MLEDSVSVVRPSSPQDLAPGTAYVVGLYVSAGGVAVRLRDHARRSTVVEFDCVLVEEDRQAPSELDRVLAVKVRCRSGSLDCSVLGTSGGRPRRVTIGLAKALALADSGAHTVLSVE